MGPSGRKFLLERPSRDEVEETLWEVGIIIQNTILKFLKTKNQTKKDPLNLKKNQKHI